MQNIILKIRLLVISFFFFGSAVACEQTDFDAWKECFIQEKQLTADEAAVFENAQFLPRVIELDRKQPESTLTFTKYKKIISLPNKIKNAKAYYEQNKDLLNEIGAKYNVEPEIIVALVGMESDFGNIMGKFNVVDSLASLSFEGRRKAFFEKELLNILKIAHQQGLGYDDFKGSWAGAMGQCQFMPSSFLSFAVDYDGDGVANIWSSKADVFASAANYLASSGWKVGNNGITRIVNDVDSKKLSKTSENNPSYKALAMNFRDYCAENGKLCEYEDNFFLLSLKDDANLQPAFLIGKNFAVLMKWNRSHYFGLSVLAIADSIKGA